MIDTSNKQFNALINGLFKKDNVKVQEALDAVMKQRIAPHLEQLQKDVAKKIFTESSDSKKSFSSLEDIKKAVDSGKTVYWSNDGYKVTKSRGDYYVVHHSGDTVGLTHDDGKTMNEKPSTFYTYE